MADRYKSRYDLFLETLEEMLNFSRQIAKSPGQVHNIILQLGIIRSTTKVQLKNSKMKIQIEPKKETSKEKFTYISYLKLQSAIPKAPENVRLSDVKNFIQKQHADLEYYFKTKNNKGKIIEVEVTNDDQPIPLLEGMIKLKTIPKETKVYFQIIDENQETIEDYLDFNGTIPISSNKLKTLEDVKSLIPDYIQKFLNNGKSVKYFFEEEQEDVGYVKKELFLDSAEVPLVELTNRTKVIECYIMISSDLSEKFKFRQKCLQYPVLSTVFLLWVLANIGFGFFLYFNKMPANTDVPVRSMAIMAFLLVQIAFILLTLLPVLIFLQFLYKMEGKFLKKHLLK